MSKSLGNVVTPAPLLDEHGSDAVRYWAANGRGGTDTAIDINQMKVGRRLCIKILNASKFVLTFPQPPADAVPTERVDLALLARLAGVIDDATAAFEAYDYARALERTEQFFWAFCDDYVELVKTRAYGNFGEEGAASAAATLRLTLSALHRLLAPFLPFVTEEVWGWWQTGSIHRSSWPTSAELGVSDAGDDVLTAATKVIAEVRRAKSDAKVSQRASVKRAVITADETTLAQLKHVEVDLKAVGSIAELAYELGNFSVLVEL